GVPDRIGQDGGDLADGLEMQLQHVPVEVELHPQAGKPGKGGFARRHTLEEPEASAQIEQALALAIVELAQIDGPAPLQGGRLEINDFLETGDAALKRDRRGAAIADRSLELRTTSIHGQLGQRSWKC